MKIPNPYCTSIRHSQSYPILSFVYSMKCRHSSSDNNFTKTSCFDLWLTPGAKVKILKPYCASARHAQSDPRIRIGNSLRCRKSSSDQKFLGRTDRGNNNIQEISVENPGIIMKTTQLNEVKHHSLIQYIILNLTMC